MKIGSTNAAYIYFNTDFLFARGAQRDIIIIQSIRVDRPGLAEKHCSHQNVFLRCVDKGNVIKADGTVPVFIWKGVDRQKC